MYTEELGPVEEQRGQSHSEDPFHLNKAAKEHKGKPKESSFVEDVSTALYQMMAEDELEGLLTDMKGYAAGTGVEKWVNKSCRLPFTSKTLSRGYSPILDFSGK